MSPHKSAFDGSDLIPTGAGAEHLLFLGALVGHLGGCVRLPVRVVERMQAAKGVVLLIDRDGEDVVFTIKKEEEVVL